MKKEKGNVSTDLKFTERGRAEGGKNFPTIHLGKKSSARSRRDEWIAYVYGN